MNTKELWTCGHTATAVCGQCYLELAQTSAQLAEKALEARDIFNELMDHIEFLEARLALADTVIDMLKPEGA